MVVKLKNVKIAYAIFEMQCVATNLKLLGEQACFNFKLQLIEVVRRLITDNNIKIIMNHPHSAVV
jgi:hypothetical protein